MQCICKMKRWQNCEFLSIFLTKEGLSKYIKHLCKIRLWDELQKEEVVGKCFVKKVFLKSTETHNFVIISYCECILKNFTKFTGKHLCWSLFFDKVAGLKPETLFKKKLQHRCLPVYFVKFLRTLSLKNTSGGCFCTKDLFLPIFCREKSFKQIFFQLSGLASSNISFYMTKLGVFIKNLFIWIFFNIYFNQFIQEELI